MRFKIPALLLGSRSFQHTLRLGASVRGAVGSRAFIVALLCGALADFAEIDDLAHVLPPAIATKVQTTCGRCNQLPPIRGVATTQGLGASKELSSNRWYFLCVRKTRVGDLPTNKQMGSLIMVHNELISHMCCFRISGS
jgi:hypothetical protein